ncbi:hypothetical protein JL107_17080 [Nakamurella flavida]|uniref:Uncharacterized protein n=1 Tax=Nakamurella flavida TaxID=363630 RepID=A0A938YMU5_9ACTN|nr:hypothetical protein [Nakamurella flavida]MBM9478164.1 hypothetical protein [Nakamurella flavida]MDP9778614.1 hypothetical protein [Nakamurella flavida]
MSEQSNPEPTQQEQQDVAGMGSYVGTPVSEEEISDVWLAGDEAEQKTEGETPDAQQPPSGS